MVIYGILILNNNNHYFPLMKVNQDSVQRRRTITTMKLNLSRYFIHYPCKFLTMIIYPSVITVATNLSK